MFDRTADTACGKRLLVLSFYYAPDLSAGSFRTTALVRALVNALPVGTDIDVITTRPNRYSSFEADVSPAGEDSGGVTVHRLPIPTHRSGLLDQSRAFAAFALAALRVVRGRRYDLVVATSSRLMTAALGSVIARSKGAPLYLDIRDIFLENIREVIPAAAYRTLQPALLLIERFAFGAATKVNVVSEGFLPYFRRRYPSLSYSSHPNGVDDEFIGFPDTHPAPLSRGAAATVLYAGNIGEGQGLHEIIPSLARSMRGRIHFRVIGDGGRRHELERRLASMGVDNVEMLPPMPRPRLLDEYAKADVLFLHLNRYKAFETVLPSKVFEYAATGRPIWAGVSGYAASFLRKHVQNAVVFEPCNAVTAERAFADLQVASQPRTEFTRQFARSVVTARMAVEIAEVVTRKP